MTTDSGCLKTMQTRMLDVKEKNNWRMAQLL